MRLPLVAGVDYPKVDERVDEVKRVTLTKVTVCKGAGTNEDPARHVDYYYDDDGNRVAVHDPTHLIVGI